MVLNCFIYSRAPLLEKSTIVVVSGWTIFIFVLGACCPGLTINAKENVLPFSCRHHIARRGNDVLLLNESQSALLVQVRRRIIAVAARRVLDVLLGLLLRVGRLPCYERWRRILRVGPGDGIRISWGRLAIRHCALDFQSHKLKSEKVHNKFKCSTWAKSVEAGKVGYRSERGSCPSYICGGTVPAGETKRQLIALAPLAHFPFGHSC